MDFHFLVMEKSWKSRGKYFLERVVTLLKHHLQHYWYVWIPVGGWFLLLLQRCLGVWADFSDGVCGNSHSWQFSSLQEYRATRCTLVWQCPTPLNFINAVRTQQMHTSSNKQTAL